MRHSDEHIYLEALSQGDKKGLIWLLEQYEKPVFHFCMKLLKESAFAEETTADVFISLWNKRKRINTHQSIQPLLYKIARDKAYDYLRKIASNERLKEKFREAYVQTDHQDGEWIYLKKEHASQVNHIVEVLPPQRQLIFKMRYFQGKDNPSIARELNLSLHTVKSQLVKARGFVRRELERIGMSNVSGFLLLLGLFS